MEGVTGVTHPQDVIPGRSEYERFRRFLTADVNAAIEGAARGGATGFLVNEVRIDEILAGLSRIPVGLVTGDDLACDEAESLYTGVKTARVKTAIDRYTARCLPQGTALDLILAAAEGAVGGVDTLDPYGLEPPYTFTVEFATASTAASVLFFPQLERTGDRRVSWTHEDYETAFKMVIGVMRMAKSDPDYG